MVLMATDRPWMVGAGNHEIEQQPGTSDLYVAFENRYRMPWVSQSAEPLVEASYASRAVI